MGAVATAPCASCRRLNRIDLARAESGAKCGACGIAIDLDRPIPVSDNDLERVLSGTGVPVLVDFYADWCAPCRAMAPVLEAFARENKGSVLVAKLDTDRNPTMAVRFSIAGIPTLIAFVNGREAAREVGAVARPRLDALIERAEAVREP